MRNYIVRVKGHEDFHIDAELNSDLDFENAAKEVLVDLEICIPVEVEVQFYLCFSSSGKQQEQFLRTVFALSPKLEMTEEEYNKKCKKALAEIPKEFHDVLCFWAEENYEDHGHENVLDYLSEIIDAFKPAFKAFQNRIIQCDCK